MADDGFDGAFRERERQPVAGRRRRAANDDDAATAPVAPQAAKGGWGMEDEKKKRSFFGGGGSDKVDKKPFAADQPKVSYDSDDETPVIPSLEDEVDDDMSRQIAQAPEFRANRVQSLRDLDRDAGYSLPVSKEEGIDLGLLLSVMIPGNQLQEPDEAWEFDSMFRSLVQDLGLNAEDDKAEEGDASK